MYEKVPSPKPPAGIERQTSFFVIASYAEVQKTVIIPSRCQKKKNWMPTCSTLLYRLNARQRPCPASDCAAPALSTSHAIPHTLRVWRS